MKFFIKIFLFSIFTISFANAAQINILYESSLIKKQLLLGLKEHFKIRYGIPHSLINIKRVQSCGIFDKRFLEVCINSKGNLVEIPNINKKEILKSLKVFKTKETF